MAPESQVAEELADYPKLSDELLATGCRLRGKTAIVTGSSSGLGREIALKFAKHGANIICADLHPQAKIFVNDDAIKPTHRRISDQGGHSVFVKTDVSESDSVQRMIKKAVETYGRLDIIVNNAGISPETFVGKSTHETDDQLFDQVMLVNSRGVFLCCKYAGQQMIQQEAHPSGDKGWIINMSSGMGLVGRVNAVAYTTAKGAVTNMTRTVALDYAPHRIHVNAVCPGWIRTAMTKPLTDDAGIERRLLQDAPFRGLGEPEDVANAVLFLASADCSYITGINLAVDGGYLAGDAQ